MPFVRPLTAVSSEPCDTAPADPVVLLIVADATTARATATALATRTDHPPRVTDVHAPDLDVLVARAGRVGVVDPSRWHAWRDRGPLPSRPLRGPDRLALLRRLRDSSALVSWLGAPAEVERAITG